MTPRDWPAASELDLPQYPPVAGVHPPLDSPAYKSSLLRAPKQPPMPLPQGLTEITGPLLGAERVTPADADLTSGHPAEPLGERIVVSGRRWTRTSPARAAASPIPRAGTSSSRSSRVPTRGATTTTRGGRRTFTSRCSAWRSPSA